jgi:peptide/nickel transport system permease protein
MRSYLVKRALLSLSVLLGAMVATFLILHLVPGDPAQLMLADVGATPAQVEALREQLGLNAPLAVQLGRFLWRSLHFDFGQSLYSRRPVMDELARQLPATVELSLAAFILATLFGVPLGIVAALSRGRWLDSLATAGAVFGVSIPAFWLGLLLIFVFSLHLGWFPVTGQGGIDRLVLPAVTLAVGPGALIARLVRSSVLEVLHKEFVRVARAKGLSASRVLFRHILRNSLIPVVTIAGLQLGAMLSGAVVVETVFSRQGVGRLAVTAILAKDFPLVQGVVFLAAVLYVTINTVVDILYALLDPVIRLE